MLTGTHYACTVESGVRFPAPPPFFMSRTKKGQKAPGYEYWGKRPGPRDPGKYSKTRTHRLERLEDKAEIKKGRKELDEQ